MFKIRRPVNYQNKAKIELILPKFDRNALHPQTGSRARAVSSSSQQSTISARLGGKMVTRETVKKQSLYIGSSSTQEFLAKVIVPIVYFTDIAKTERVVVLPGILIVVKGDIAWIGNRHVAVTPDQYIALSQNQ